MFVYMLANCDRHGTIDVTAETIALRSRIPLESVQRGLGILERVDRRSRNPEAEGRRVTRLDEHRDWGWQIVNYEYYRGLVDEDSRRIKARERKRKQRELAAMQRTSHAVTECPALSLHAEAEAEVEAEAKESPPPRPVRAKRSPAAIRPEFLQQLESDYPTQDIPSAMEEYLNHAASKKHSNKEIGLRNWVKRDADRGWNGKPKRVTFGDDDP